MSRISSNSDKIHAALKKLRDESNAKELELIDLVASVYEAAKEKKDEVVDRVKDTASSIDTSVHLHPWRYIGGAVLAGLIIGRFLKR